MFNFFKRKFEQRKEVINKEVSTDEKNNNCAVNDLNSKEFEELIDVKEKINQSDE